MGLFDKLLGRGNSANNDSKDISVLHEEKSSFMITVWPCICSHSPLIWK